MHTCEVRIGTIPEGADFQYECGWWYQDEIDLGIIDDPQWQKAIPCGAPANKKLGLVWVCDEHFHKHESLVEDPDDPVTPLTNPVIGIYEAGGDEDEE